MTTQDELTALKAENERLRGVVTNLTFWVEGALNCKTWNWDGDQHEAATWCLNNAIEALKGGAS